MERRIRKRLRQMRGVITGFAGRVARLERGGLGLEGALRTVLLDFWPVDSLAAADDLEVSALIGGVQRGARTRLGGTLIVRLSVRWAVTDSLETLTERIEVTSWAWASV